MKYVRHFFYQLYDMNCAIYSLPNNLKNITTKFMYSSCWFFIFFSIFLLISQYAIYSIPNLNVTEEASFWVGFLNGYCVFFNAIISVFSNNYSVIEPNVTTDYYSGFAFGTLYTYFATVGSNVVTRYMKARFAESNI